MEFHTHPPGTAALFSYNLGERVSSAQRDALAHLPAGADPLVLVGDVGFGDALHTYIQEGIEGVHRLYLRRKACGEGRACQRDQIPSASGLDALIDER